MNKETRTRRIIELLNKEDLNCEGYDELKRLLEEDDKEYYHLKEKYKDYMYETK